MSLKTELLVAHKTSLKWHSASFELWPVDGRRDDGQKPITRDNDFCQFYRDFQGHEVGLGLGLGLW